MDQIVHLDGKVYRVALNTVREAEPGRMLCDAWYERNDGVWREVQNIGRLDALARMVGAKDGESE